MLLFTFSLRREDDIITARQRARDVARALGFEARDQARIATAVSELTRTVVGRGSTGSIEYHVEGDSVPQLLVVRVVDSQLANGDVAALLAGRHDPTGHLGGIVGARRLVDRFDVAPTSVGTAVTIKQIFPRGARAWTESDLKALVRELELQARRKPAGVLDELKQQNRELADALQQVEDRQRELTRLNAELFDTNRGVVALYAELDEKAEHLRNADELKTRFLSNMSHEFRTPLNSILALTRLLNERVDGELSQEQEKQVGYIRKSALELLELVNDLLDLAKVEAGKVVMRPAQFSMDELFSTLRGMLRPMLVGQTIGLVFEDASMLPPVYGDEGKVAQVLRNFLSNALKFTERGEIRVRATSRDVGETSCVILCVQDTGIGIAAQDQERIFEDFTQVDNPLQKRVHGTGLGLPLCRKLAQLMGGKVWVESEPGHGSQFFLSIPLRYVEKIDELPPEEPMPSTDERLVALLVEDRVEDRAVIEACLRGSAFTVVSTDRVSRARELLVAKQPAVVILDIALKGEDSWRFLPEVKRLGLPVVVVSTADERVKGASLGADAWAVKPASREWLRETLAHVVLRTYLPRVLLVDDDIAMRTLLKVMLEPHCAQVAEATNGQIGWDLLNQGGADLVILDLAMPVMGGLEMLYLMRRHATLAGVPVIVCSSMQLDTADHDRLAALNVSLLSKLDLTREALVEAILLTLARTRRLPVEEQPVRRSGIGASS